MLELKKEPAIRRMRTTWQEERVRYNVRGDELYTACNPYPKKHYEIVEVICKSGCDCGGVLVHEVSLEHCPTECLLLIIDKFMVSSPVRIYARVLFLYNIWN